MTDESINFNVTGTETLIHSAKRVGDAFERSQRVFNKYKTAGSNLSKLANGAGSVANAAQSQSSFFYVLARLTEKLISSQLESNNNKLKEFIKGVKNEIGIINKLISSPRIKNILRPVTRTKSLMQLRYGIKKVKPITIDSVLLNVKNKASDIAKGVGFIVQKGFKALEKVGTISGFVTGRILSGLINLPIIAGAAIAAVLATGVLLDRRVQAMFSKAVDFVQTSIIKPVTEFGIKFFEAYKFGLQKLSGGLLQTASLDVNKESIDKLSLPAEIDAYLQQIKFSDQLAGLDVTGIKERQDRIEKIINDNQIKHNQQIDDIIEAQKFKGRN